MSGSQMSKHSVASRSGVSVRATTFNEGLYTIGLTGGLVTTRSAEGLVAETTIDPSNPGMWDRQRNILFLPRDLSGPAIQSDGRSFRPIAGIPEWSRVDDCWHVPYEDKVSKTQARLRRDKLNCVPITMPDTR